jgi:hypothetical protein
MCMRVMSVNSEILNSLSVTVRPLVQCPSAYLRCIPAIKDRRGTSKHHDSSRTAPGLCNPCITADFTQ